MDRRITRMGPMNIELNKRVSPLTKQAAKLTWNGDYDKRSCRRIQKRLYKIYRSPLQYGELVELAYYIQDCSKYYGNFNARMIMREVSNQLLNFAQWYEFELL